MRARGHILVVGNAKGGSGKSTTAMHIIARLQGLGHTVAVLDLDGRQQTLCRYLQNRSMFSKTKRLNLPMPAYDVVDENLSLSRATLHKLLCKQIESFIFTHPFVLIDCPGSDTFLTRVAHGLADTIVTPVNDSFIDLDLLAHIDANSLEMVEPSWYSEMIFEQRKARLLRDKHQIDWVVVRNRMTHTDARNKRNVIKVLEKLGPSLGFRQIAGLSERVIFRELFLKGLTLTDLRAHRTGIPLSMTHVAAVQEIRDLVRNLHLPGVDARAQRAASK
jgi:chromosome partitioning protein